MSDLTTLAAVELYLGIASGSPDETLLSALITAASAAIESWCGRSFASQAVTELRDGGGGDRMMFGNYPVTAVSSVAIDGRAVAASSGPTSPGYYFSTVALSLRSYRFHGGSGNVELAYTAGYATIPADLAQAANELIGHQYKEIPRLGKSSEGLAQQTTSYVIRDFPPRVATILGVYRKVVPIGAGS